MVAVHGQLFVRDRKPRLWPRDPRPTVGLQDRRVATRRRSPSGSTRPHSRPASPSREAGLELMLPLLDEPQPPVPRDGSRGILDVENRHDLLVHGQTLTGCSSPSRECASTKGKRALATGRYRDGTPGSPSTSQSARGLSRIRSHRPDEPRRT
jgi:hypothetical protein